MTAIRILLATAGLVIAVHFFLDHTWPWRVTADELASDRAAVGFRSFSDSPCEGLWVTVHGTVATLWPGRTDRILMGPADRTSDQATDDPMSWPRVVMVDIPAGRDGASLIGTRVEFSGRVIRFGLSQPADVNQFLGGQRLKMPQLYLVDGRAPRFTLRDLVPLFFIGWSAWQILMIWRRRKYRVLQAGQSTPTTGEAIKGPAGDMNA